MYVFMQVCVCIYAGIFNHGWSHMHSKLRCICACLLSHVALTFSIVSGHDATTHDSPQLWDPSRLWVCMPWGAEVARGCDSKPRKLLGLGHVRRPMYRCIDRASRLRP